MSDRDLERQELVLQRSARCRAHGARRMRRRTRGGDRASDMPELVLPPIGVALDDERALLGAKADL